jgi:hypothetical protein
MTVAGTAAGFTGYDEATKKAIFAVGKEKSTSWGNLDAEAFMKHLIPDEIEVATMQFQEIGTSGDGSAPWPWNTTSASRTTTRSCSWRCRRPSARAIRSAA